GIGNVYRSELLFLAGVHPLTVAQQVPEEAVADIWSRTVVALKTGERMGRIVTVVPAEMGAKTPRELARGDRLYTYKRDGYPCRRCGDEIRSADADGRNVWWCPSCQPPAGALVSR
ncbi:MAG: zinc finger domain-containing protein, partial [Acidimicrobiales bacterium]